MTDPSAPPAMLATCLAGKRFAVLGLARSGLATVRMLVRSGAQVMAWDSRDEPKQSVIAEFGDAVEIADPVQADLTGFDGLVVSPGVPLNRHPVAEVAAQYGVPIIGDIELFALARPDLPPHRVIGITGTNGKSTTTALVHHLLRNAALPTRMGGNIGLPILDQEPLPAGGVYVLELSSYQIDLTRNLACDVAALINITPDHLDRYAGFAAYAASKGRLLAMQRADQHAVFGTGDPETRAVCRAMMLEAATIGQRLGHDGIVVIMFGAEFLHHRFETNAGRHGKAANIIALKSNTPCYNRYIRHPA